MTKTTNTTKSKATQDKTPAKVVTAEPVPADICDPDVLQAEMVLRNKLVETRWPNGVHPPEATET